MDEFNIFILLSVAACAMANSPVLLVDKKAVSAEVKNEIKKEIQFKIGETLKLDHYQWVNQIDILKIKDIGEELYWADVSVLISDTNCLTKDVWLNCHPTNKNKRKCLVSISKRSDDMNPTWKWFALTKVKCVNVA